ncbi:MAG: glycopeptide antibiotics resistance protein [bacterium]|jgi:glycopeptide antibiotics resistance protein
MLSLDHLQYKRVWLALGTLTLSVVFALSINTIPPRPKTILVQDKAAVAYAVLVAWFAQIFQHDLARLFLVSGLVLFGLGIEFAQGLVPARQFDYKDAVANTSGIVCSWGLAYTWVRNMFVKAEQLCRRLRVSGPIRV